MRQHIEIGSCPGEEECAQVGKPDYERLGKLECRAYIVALIRVVGTPPEGSRLVAHANSHDLGTYYDVRYVFESEDGGHQTYAAMVENGLRTWAEAGMWRPVAYDDRGNMLSVIDDPDLWITETNPLGHTTKERRDAAQAEQSG